MSDVLILAAFFLFVLFFFSGWLRKYAAIGGWTLIVINLVSEIPAYLIADNFLYPVLALLSIPFLIITARALLRDDPVAIQLSRAAAVATIIYVPFAFIPVVRDMLIRSVVNQAFWIIQTLGHHPQMPAWNIIAENGFANQIVLGCTGITAIAMLLGAVAGVPHLSYRKGISAFLIIVPLLYLLNLLRVAIVFIAVSDAWFRSFPDLSPDRGIGATDFFWAHNVFAEALAIVALLVIIIGLFRLVPGLAVLARDLVDLYTGSITAFFRRGSA
jgi:archaeosortase A (PGF-CTERM-specific)